MPLSPPAAHRSSHQQEQVALRLTTRSLCKSYSNGVQALQAVDLDIEPGLFGLLGRNGAGKSTLMRTLATLQLPDSGTAQLGAIDLLRDPQALRRTLGYLPQSFGVYPVVSAERLLDHLARLRGLRDRALRDRKVGHLLELVNLDRDKHRAVAGFSGGMRQRFGIAQALLGDPTLLIVDEPTAGLDPEERHRFYDVLGSCAQQRIVLLSTHWVEDVNSLCSRLAILDRGRIAAQGTPEQLISPLEHRVWQRQCPLATTDNFWPGATLLRTRILRGHREFRVLCDGPPDTSFQPATPTLEDAYFYQIARNKRPPELREPPPSPPHSQPSATA